MLCTVARRHDFVKVLDFGLAKSVSWRARGCVAVDGRRSALRHARIHRAGGGTRRADVDARADLYALGCVAYVLLTGTLVFPDPNPVELTLKHVTGVPDPPSLRTELPIPSDLERIILQCLEKNPADRPASARELRREVGNCVASTGPSATPRLWTAPPAGVLVAAIIRSGGAAHAVGGPEGLTMNYIRASHARLASRASLAPVAAGLQDARRAAQEPLERLLSLFADVRAGEGVGSAPAHRQHLPAAGRLFADEAGTRRADPDGRRRRSRVRIRRPPRPCC